MSKFLLETKNLKKTFEHANGHITLFDKLSSNFGEVEITAKELDEVEEKQWVVFPYEEWWK